MAIETNELIDVKTLSPFKKFIMTIGNLPTSYLESMTYGEMLMWFCNYLQETVIPTVNNNALAVEELQNLYEELKSYVDNYFENLDVQSEIDAKLDKMAESGQLTNLIKDYVDPIYTAYETEINEDISNFKAQVNTSIGSIQNQVTSIASGSPKGVYDTVSDLTTADPDHNSIYLVTADGKWYYYDGANWTAGGTYQATGVGSNEVDIDNLVENMQSSLNLIIPEITQETGNYIYKSGGISSLTSGRITDPLHLFKGDILVFTAKGSGTNVALLASYKVDNGYYPLVLSDGNNEVTITYIIEYDGYYSMSSVTQDVSDVKIYRKNITNEYVAEDYTFKTFNDNIICDENIGYITGKYIIYSSGVEGELASYKCTDFIEIKNNSKINLESSYKLINATDISGVAFYDKDRTYISGVQLPESTKLELTSPANAKYIRISLTPLMMKNGFNLYYSSILNLINNIDPVRPTDNIFTMFNNITCIGDSLTYSQVYTSANNSRQAYNPYPTILQKLSNTNCRNLAHSGDSATDAWNRQENNIISLTNQLTIIYLGANAGLTDTVNEDVVGSNYQLYANTNTGNYAKIIKKSLDLGSKVLLVKCYASSGNLETTNSVIDQLGTKFNVAVIDNDKLTENKYHYYPDLSGSNSVHYNDLGYQAFTEQLIRNASDLSDSMIQRIFPQ